MEIIIALLFVACLAACVFVTFRKGDAADSVDYDELVRPGGGELRVKGLTEILSGGSNSVRETLSAIMGPTYPIPGYVKPRPEKKPRDKEADLLRRYGLLGRFAKRERQARKERALRAGVPYYELRREVRG